MSQFSLCQQNRDPMILYFFNACFLKCPMSFIIAKQRDSETEG